MHHLPSTIEARLAHACSLLTARWSDAARERSLLSRRKAGWPGLRQRWGTNHATISDPPFAGLHSGTMTPEEIEDARLQALEHQRDWNEQNLFSEDLRTELLDEIRRYKDKNPQAARELEDRIRHAEDNQELEIALRTQQAFDRLRADALLTPADVAFINDTKGLYQEFREAIPDGQQEYDKITSEIRQYQGPGVGREPLPAE